MHALLSYSRSIRLLALLIVAAGGPFAHGGDHPDAFEIFRCSFDSAWDQNYDHWPDRWIRKTGPDYPSYVAMEIVADETADLGHCLKISLNGGAAAMFSPLLPIDSRFSYQLAARLKTSGLKHDWAYLSVTYYDAQQRPLESFYSPHRRESPDWSPLEIEPFSAADPLAVYAMIGLHIAPNEKQDLSGWVKFDDIRLDRLPKLTLTTNRPSNVYTDPQQVQVHCTLSGVSQPDPQLNFELLDATDRVIARTHFRLAGEAISVGRGRATRATAEAEAEATTYAGSVDWNPPLVGDGGDQSNAYGFYRVRVTVEAASGSLHQQEAPFAVVRPLVQFGHGEFGWSLPDGDRPLSFDALIELLPQVGINWIKLPVWYSEDEPHRGDQLMWFAERLDSRDIQIVGLLTDPPASVLKKLAVQPPVSAANIFTADSAAWLPSLDLVMTRLSLKIRWWQLGGDRDASFIGYPELPKKIGQIKRKLYRFGQEVHLGIAWRWLAETLDGQEIPWEFLSYSADPPLTGDEMAVYLGRADYRHAKSWVLIEPLPRSEYSLETRTRDLVDQMLAAKIHQADGIFVPQPFSTERGLMNDDGSPGELLLPWRTTALTLGGAEYVGSIRMPSGSRNQIFARGGEAVMVVWNERPVKEVLYLGEDVRQVDIWGRMTRPAQAEAADRRHCQVIEVGPHPTFLLGVNEQVARWRIAVRFEHERMPSVFDQAHRNALRMTNPFNQAASGHLTLVMPEIWDVYPRKINFTIAAAEAFAEPFDVKLPFTASSGSHAVRIDFDIHVDRPYRFSVYRDLGIGMGEVEIETSTKLDEHGTLIVEQRMINHSDRPIDFKCLLHAPDRRRQSTQVFDLGRGESVKYYRYADGQELIGEQLWLRAEEIGGPRILNYRFMVKTNDE